MKYKKNDVVYYLSKEAIIAGTKTNPSSEKSNPYNQKIYPKKGYDYIIMLKEENNNYKGHLDVMEKDLTSKI